MYLINRFCDVSHALGRFSTGLNRDCYLYDCAPASALPNYSTD